MHVSESWKIVIQIRQMWLTWLKLNCYPGWLNACQPRPGSQGAINENLIRKFNNEIEKANS